LAGLALYLAMVPPNSRSLAEYEKLEKVSEFEEQLKTLVF